MGLQGEPLFEKTIGEMKVGESGYVVPWALSFDENETPYLSLRRSITTSPCGTSCMPIKRTGPLITDYEINLDFQYGSEGRYSWHRSDLGSMLDSDIVCLSPIKNSPKISNEVTFVVKPRSVDDFVLNSGKFTEKDRLIYRFNEAVSNDDFEEAARLQDQIKKLEES